MSGRTLLAFVALSLPPLGSAGAQERGIVLAAVALPPAGSAYRGGTHTFPGGIRLTCGSHGGFTSAVPPPAGPGSTVIADYRATFVGELAVPSTSATGATVHAVDAPVHMVERLAFGERRGEVQILETELVALDLGGGGIPEGVLVRESPAVPSPGRTTITPVGRGRSRIESVYDVWLELSTDGGRTWTRADAAVRMELVPVAGPARGLAPGG